jgi:hypothetical protein
MNMTITNPGHQYHINENHNISKFSLDISNKENPKS